jgi:hypothetical protein
MMDVATFERLLTDTGQRALERAVELLHADSDVLRAIVALERGGVDAPLARAAMETAQLRRKAIVKFPRADGMYFTREALEQASSPVCSAHRAMRFRGRTRIVDFGCGIASDSIAFSAQAPTLGLDRDPLRLRMARANVAACGSGNPASFVQTNWETDSQPPVCLPAGSAVFCDPSRREEDRRVFSVQKYSPSLDRLDAWRGHIPKIPFCVKASPGIRLEEIADASCEVEFLSVQGELKEAVLWYGDFNTTRRRATLLPHEITMTETEPASDALSAPMEYLYDPDPSVLRAGLVQHLAAKLSAARIDPQIAYLTAPERRPSPWARAFRLEEVMPFGLKRLREWLRIREVGHVVIKKRGSPIVPEELEHQLRLRGDGERVIFLTRVLGKPLILIGSALKADTERLEVKEHKKYLR